MIHLMIRENPLQLPGGARIDGAALRIEFSRSGGPGGQNVNKVSTKAELWLPLGAIHGLPPGAMDRLIALAGSHLTSAGKIHLWSSEHRTQERNRAEALEKLRALILRALVRPKRRRPTRPTASSRARRLESKRRRGQIKSNRNPKMEE
jgi:ribosome-associated protein